MKNRYLKIVALFVGISVVSSSAFAGPDIVNTLLHAIRSVSSALEAVDNELTKIKVKEIYEMLGDKSKLVAQFVDAGASVAFDKYAPVVVSELQGTLKKGYNAIPDIRSYVQKEMSALSSSDVVKQAEALVQINERLNLNAAEGLAKAKSVLAMSNNFKDEAASQLKAAMGAGTLQGKIVQESSHDLQILKREVSLNQLQAQLINTTATNVVADTQNSTPDSKETQDEAKDPSLLEKMIGSASSMLDTVKEKAGGVVDTVKGAAATAMSKVKEVASSTIDKVKNSEFVQKAVATIKDKASGAMSTITSVASSVTDKVKGVASTAMQKAADAGYGDLANKVKDVASSAMGSIERTATNAITNVKNVATSTMDSIGKGDILGAVDKVKNAGTNTVNNIKNTASDITADAMSAGVKVATEKIDGVTSTAVDKMKKTAGDAIDKIGDLMSNKNAEEKPANNTKGSTAEVKEGASDTAGKGQS